jgi:hypothetical protein
MTKKARLNFTKIKKFVPERTPSRNRGLKEHKVTIKAPAHLCLLQHYSQLSCGNSQDAPLLMSGLRKCIYIQWNFIQP